MNNGVAEIGRGQRREIGRHRDPDRGDRQAQSIFRRATSELRGGRSQWHACLDDLAGRLDERGRGFSYGQVEGTPTLWELALWNIGLAKLSQQPIRLRNFLTNPRPRSGSYSRREVDREFREYLKKQKRRDEQVAAELANQAKVVSIAALVEQNAKAAVLTDAIKANDDEDAILALLLAA